MADEVYQENIYQSKTPFVSCKKVSCSRNRSHSMDAPPPRSLSRLHYLPAPCLLETEGK